MEQNDIPQLMFRHIGTDIESMNIFQVFLNCTCLPEITQRVKSSIWVVVVAMVFPDAVLDLFPGSIAVPISSPLF